MTAPYRRRCLYVHGFDGRGPRHYEPLLRNGCETWARRECVEIEVDRVERNPHVARFAAQRGGDRPVHATFEILRWDAHVRAVSPRGVAIVPAALGVLATILWRAPLRRWWRRFRPALLVTLMPGLLVLFAALALVSLVFAQTLGEGWTGLLVPSAFLALVFATIRYATPNALAWIAAGMRHELAVAAGATSLPDGTRGALAAHLREALTDPDADETLVIAHSVGARVAISLLADVLREGGAPPRTVQFLTLAQSTALIAGMPGADALRSDLRVLAQVDLNWVDVTSPVDGANTALTDPVREVFGPDAPGGARTFNAWFRATRDPAIYAAARRDRYAMHFLYLGVPERPDPRHLDFFDMAFAPGPALARYGRAEETGPFYASRKDEPWRPSPSASGVAKPA